MTDASRDAARAPGAAQPVARTSEQDAVDFLDAVGVPLHRLSPDGTVLWANQAELDLLGYRREEYVGHPIAEFRADTGDPDDLATRLARGETLRNYPARMRAKDGTLRDVLITASPLMENGKLLHTRCITTDVTGQQRARDAQNLLAAIVDSSHDAIVSKSLDGIILSWNAGAERLFGYSAAEAVGQPITLIIPPELRDQERTILARLRLGERIDHFETVRMTRNGRRIDISLTISPVRDADGRIIGASKIARDITERRLAAERLKEADRRKDEFLATLAHELRNPLAPVRYTLETIHRAGDDGRLLRQSREILERQVGQMARLIDDLLDVSRITHDKLELRPEQIDLATIVQQAVESCRPLIDDAGHNLLVRLPDEPVRIHADKARIAQVLGNLLSNACKYMAPGGEIRLRAARQGGEVVVSVQDDGEGIPADRLDSIFEMFAQSKSASERARGGLGIGLTLVKRLVEMHGGSVRASSPGPGRGSEFVVRLPVAEARAAALTDQPAVPPPGAKVARRVLVVDDNRDSAAALATLLTLAGHQARSAHDGSESIVVAESFRPEAVLLDLGLPEMDGYEVCRIMRREPWGQNIAIIALTGWGQEQDRQRSRDAGFDEHLVKPADLATIEALLAGLP